MIDLHCHILPGVDDGSKSLEMSLRMARLAVADGIKAIVATPHTMDGVYENRAPDILPRVEAFQAALYEEGIDLRMYPGADVHLCSGMVERIRNDDVCSINHAGKFVLLEMPSQSVPSGIKDEIFALKLNGITPIITHPERNAVIQHDTGILHELVRMGALAQVTAMSLTGDFGEFIGRVSATLLRCRLVHIIASDAHSDEDRAPLLSCAVERAAEILKNYEEAENMVKTFPAAILSGQTPDVPEPVRIKRTSRSF